MSTVDTFLHLAELPRWVPFKLVYDPKRKKFDKIPHSGARGLSTKDPLNWLPLEKAIELAGGYGLSGVGFVMTGGIEEDGWTLVGFDYDNVDFEHFKPIYENSYTEKSPSGTGVRSFVWVPTEWAKKYRDSNIFPRNCNHCEVYFGTAPRFLTVTFDVIDDLPIAKIDNIELRYLEVMKLNLADDGRVVSFDIPENLGKLINLKKLNLTPEQRHLVDGTGKIDRSAVLHGLLIKLIDNGIVPEDILATMLKTPALWAYLTEHRNGNQSRAVQFAKEEMGRAKANSRTGMRENLTGFNSKWAGGPPKPDEDFDLKFPIELFDRAPGLIGEIARWIHQASYSPRPEFSYACALSMMACLIGPYCTLGTRKSKLNLYLCLIGCTGSGKNEAFDSMVKLLAETDAKDCVLDCPASEAGLRRQLNVTPNVLIRIDEMAHKLESMSNTSTATSLNRAMLEMYNGARMPPKVYGDAAKSLPAVENPFVQIIGGSTDKVWDVLRSTQLEDGTLNRFIFVCLPDDPDYQRNTAPSADVPKHLKDKLNAFFRNGRMDDLTGYGSGGRNIKIPDDVLKASLELDRSLWELTKKEFGNLYTRLIMNAEKIAGILAVADGRLEVNMQDFEQAKVFMQWCVNNTYNKVKTKMADTNFERQSKRLMSKLEKEKRMTMRAAYKYMHIPRREMEEITVTMSLAGEASIEEIENKNGTITEWLILLEKEGE